MRVSCVHSSMPGTSCARATPPASRSTPARHPMRIMISSDLRCMVSIRFFPPASKRTCPSAAALTTVEMPEPSMHDGARPGSKTPAPAPGALPEPVMKAAVVGEHGVEIRDVEKPTPNPNEVLVRVRATSLNRADLLVSLGHRHGAVGGLGARLGLECAGEVEAIGS